MKYQLWLNGSIIKSAKMRFVVEKEAERILKER